MYKSSYSTRQPSLNRGVHSKTENHSSLVSKVICIQLFLKEKTKTFVENVMRFTHFYPKEKTKTFVENVGGVWFIINVYG